jgi:type IV pilus assembly protein PilA
MTVRSQEGFTLIELLIVTVVIGIVTAIAIPGLLRARITGNEASAISSLRAVVNAQSVFASSCGNGLYAQTLDLLGTGPSGGAGFISADLASAATVTKSGYSVAMTGSSVAGTACNGATALASGYHVWADPVSSFTGLRYFGTNKVGTIWQSTATLSGMTDADSPPPPAVAIQ